MRCEGCVERDVQADEHQRGKTAEREPFERLPLGKVLRENRRRHPLAREEAHVIFVRLYHHRHRVRGVVWGMRITLRIRKRVVHAVHNCVGTRVEERGTLQEPRDYKKEALPEFRHGELLVRTVAVQVETVHEKGCVPMHDDGDDDYDHVVCLLFVWLCKNRVRIYVNITREVKLSSTFNVLIVRPLIHTKYFSAQHHLHAFKTICSTVLLLS